MVKHSQKKFPGSLALAYQFLMQCVGSFDPIRGTMIDDNPDDNPTIISLLLAPR